MINKDYRKAVIWAKPYRTPLDAKRWRWKSASQMERAVWADCFGLIQKLLTSLCSFLLAAVPCLGPAGVAAN